jgi:hypothetical protein
MNVLDDNFTFATKSTSVNARGKKRTIGKGKKSSAISPTNSDIENEVIEKKKRKNNNQMKKLQYKENKKIAEKQLKNISNPIQSGSSKLFQGQRNSKSLLSTVVSTIDRTPHFFSIDTLYSINFNKNIKLIDPNYNNRIKIKKQRIDYDAYQWSFQLQSNFNLLLYGVGCKKSLIQSFSKSWLAGEDVIEIDSNIIGDNNKESIKYQSKNILRQLIEVITTSILTKTENYLFQAQTSLDVVCKNLVNLLNIHYGRNEDENNNELENEFSRSMVNSNLIDDSINEDDYDSTNEDDNNMIDMNKEINDNIDTNEDVNKRCEQNLLLHKLLFDCGEGNINNNSSNNRRSSRRNVLNNNVYGNYNNGVSKNIEKIIEADHRWGGRYTQAKSRLYIIIHGIDGNSLQSSEIQACLSILSSSTSVSIIASSDSFNAPMLWSDEVHARFKWLFHHVPTFELYQNSIIYQEKEKNWDDQNIKPDDVNYILKSIIPRHREVLRYICKDAIERRKNNDIIINNNENKYDAISEGITLKELSSYCISNMVTKTDSELNLLLKELSEQSLISFIGNDITHKLSTEYELLLANEL